MTTDNAVEEVRDTDKDIFMDVRGIIDGVVDSGNTDYQTALELISETVKDYSKSGLII